MTPTEIIAAAHRIAGLAEGAGAGGPFHTDGAQSWIDTAHHMSSLIAEMVPYVRGAVWQGIESAPKDGSEILIWRAPWRNGISAYWTNECEFGEGETGEGWQIQKCDGDSWHSVGADNATHWQALPPSPDKGT